MSFVTDDVKRGIEQLRFIENQFLNGTLDPVAVRRMLQDIIEYKFTPPVTTPSWYSSVDVQFKKVSTFLKLHARQDDHFLPSDIPTVPNFTPRTKYEVLLLTVMLPDKGRLKGVRRTFDAWWDFIVPPTGLTMWRGEELKSDSKHLRLARSIEYKPGIRWVAFDPNTYQGRSPKDALAQSAINGTTLAQTEVLMAAALLPDWPVSWNGGTSPYPNMSGLHLHWGSGWSNVPCLSRCDVDARLELRSNWTDGWARDAHDFWSSPTVREC